MHIQLLWDTGFVEFEKYSKVGIGRQRVVLGHNAPCSSSNMGKGSGQEIGVFKEMGMILLEGVARSGEGCSKMVHHS